MRHHQSGQTLVALLVFMSIAMLVTMAAAAVTIINLQGNSSFARGETALQIAESGIDNALLRIIRDPNYAGETLAVGDGTATISVSGTTTKTIVSQAVLGNYRRTITATATYSNAILTIVTWSETP